MFSIELLYFLGFLSALAWLLYKAPGAWLCVLALIGALFGNAGAAIVAGFGSVFMLWFYLLYETD